MLMLMLMLDNLPSCALYAFPSANTSEIAGVGKTQHLVPGLSTRSRSMSYAESSKRRIWDREAMTDCIIPLSAGEGG
jgi:hypothetical protein